MIVVDTSAAIELLLGTAAGNSVKARLFQPNETLHAPHMLDIEVAQVIRRYAARKAIATERVLAALELLAALSITRYSHAFLLPRVWQLRDNLTAYDAVYVASAEALGAKLITRDIRLSRAVGHTARIETI